MGDSQATAHAFLLEADGTLHTLAPPQNFQSAQGVAVNRWGDVAGRGRWQASPGDPVVLHAFLWNPFTDEFIDLGTLPGTTFSRSYAINDRWEIVGLCNNSRLTDQVAFYWHDGQMNSVESLDDPTSDLEMKIAFAINHLGSITGLAFGDGLIATSAGTFLRPVLYDLDDDSVVGVSDLLLLLGEWGIGRSIADINGDGTVSVVDLLLLLGHWG